MAERRKANPDAPSPVHLVVPDTATADVLVSIADNLAGIELSRLRWERDVQMGRPALTFNGEPAEMPAAARRVGPDRGVVSPRGGPSSSAQCCGRRSSTSGRRSLDMWSPAVLLSRPTVSTTSWAGLKLPRRTR